MARARQILLIDDDEILRDSLAEQLELTGEFATDCASTGDDGVARASDGDFELILLDVGLPDRDGREVCRQLRDAKVAAPIIMLTGATGDNDYVTKPFKFNVLLARIRAQLRQHEQSEDAVFGIGPYTFKPSAKLLFDDERQGKKIRLTEKETAILKYLYRAEGAVVGRQTLLTEVWGYNAEVTTHTLETHIYRLRQKIERDPANAMILVTEPGGYRLAAGAGAI